jgi:AbrB family looped-hinge helix DNA binding protein
MEIVTVSPKYQVVIPQNVREQFGLRMGEKLNVIPYQNRIELIPVKEMRRMRGFLKGMSTDFERDRGQRV